MNMFVNTRMPWRLFLLVGLIATAAGAQTGAEALNRGVSPEDQAETSAVPPPSNALDKDDLEIYVRHLYMWRPEVKVEIGDPSSAPIEGLLRIEIRASYKMAAQNKILLVSKDGQHILDGSQYEIAKNPFAANYEKIDAMGAPGFGTEGAPVRVVVYSDFQCPFCAKEAKMLRTQLLKEYPEEVRVYYRDFPLAKHKWAMPAAIAGQCVHETDPETYWQYFDWVFESQKSITPENFKDRFTAFLAGTQLDSAKVTECFDGGKTEEKVKDSMKEAYSVGVSSTPTLFINGRKVRAGQWAQLKPIMDNEIAYQKIANNAGDDCGCAIAPELPGFQ